MFNPDGVKGKIAQPHHKIFNFMAPRHYDTWHITLNVKDVKTGIQLPTYEWTGLVGNKGGSYRAERRAIAAFKYSVFAEWRRKTCDEYGLTARQLERMIEDGIVHHPDLFEVTVAKAECKPCI